MDQNKEDRHQNGLFERNTPDDLFKGSYEWINCHMSNDPPEDDRAIDALTKCNTTEYFCETSSDNAGNSDTSEIDGDVSQPLEIDFEYEVHFQQQQTTSEADADKNQLKLNHTILPYLEETMLEHLASTMDLISCHRRRRRQLAGFAKKQVNSVVGVSLVPRDTISHKHSMCQSVYDSNSVINTACFPIQGSLTIFLKLGERDNKKQRWLQEESQQESIRHIVLNALQQSMDDDLFVVPGSIEKIVFIDSHGISSKNASGETLGAQDIGLIVGGAATFLLLLLLCCCCCLCCRKCHSSKNDPEDANSTESSNQSSHDSTEDDDDVQGAATLAELDSLALQPQDNDVSTVQKVDGDLDILLTSSTCDTSTAPHHGGLSKSTSMVDKDKDDDSLFEFTEVPLDSFHDSSLSNISHIRSSDFTTARSASPSTAMMTTASNITMLHANKAVPPAAVSAKKSGTVRTYDAAYTSDFDKYDAEFMSHGEYGSASLSTSRSDVSARTSLQMT